MTESEIKRRLAAFETAARHLDRLCYESDAEKNAAAFVAQSIRSHAGTWKRKVWTTRTGKS